MEMELIKYADLLLKKGLNIQEGEPLLIVGPTERMDFIRLLTKRAYEIGIRRVEYLLEDEQIRHEALLTLTEEEIEHSSLFDRTIIKEISDAGGCLLYLEGCDPNLMSDVPPSKLAAMRRISIRTQGDSIEKRGKYDTPWVIAAVPTEAFAKKVFGETDAVEKLWKAIFKCCYIDKEDPLQYWDEKMIRDEKRARKLTQLQLTKLHYKNDLGTDLVIGLNPGTIWEAAATRSATKNRNLLVNIPTEEVFTSPNYREVNGTVYASKPLVHNGSIIENFSLVFKEGKVVEYHAEKGGEYLKAILDTDEGAKYLGEAALVEYHSPISSMNILFYTTLYDENASCHLALGRGFPLCIENGGEMSKEELLEAGVNDSDTHVDFMIGTSDLSIVGEDADGKLYPIFEKGDFCLEEA